MTTTDDTMRRAVEAAAQAIAEQYGPKLVNLDMTGRCRGPAEAAIRAALPIIGAELIGLVEAGLQPPYPDGKVIGPCVCGSWPGGECLRCEWRPATLEDRVATIRARLAEMLGEKG